MDDEREHGLNEEFVDDFGDDDDSIDWLEHFTTDAPPLNLNFYRASNDRHARFTQESFVKRLSQCLGARAVFKFPEGLMSALFKMGVQQKQQCDAYNEFLKTLNDVEFTNTLRFVHKEHQRVNIISKVLEIQRNPSLPRQMLVPRQMFEWDKVWMGSLRELVKQIEVQLGEWDDRLVKQQHYWLKLRRTNIETHLLEVALSTIAEKLKEHNIPFDKHWMLVAYAHAALLVAYDKEDDRDASVAAMKMRIARARKSKNKIAMLSLFFSQLVQDK